MTREQKLALIIGFSLVLLVGVLISDHLSRARQAKIASVGGSEGPSASFAVKPPSDPLKALDLALNTPANPPAETRPPVASSQPPNLAPTQLPSGSAPAPGTATLASRPPNPANAGGADDTALGQAVRDAGGTLLVRKDGITDIILPEAAKGTTLNVNAGRPPQSTLLQTSPLYGIPNPAKNLATNEQFKLHAVQQGETLFQISAKYYGTGHVWRELAQFNGVTNKDGVVRVGTRLKIPSKDVLLGRPSPVETAGRTAPATTTPTDKVIPSRRQDMPVVKPDIRLATYTVKKGETLGEISKKVLGSSKRWQELAEFNKLDDEDAIAAGTVLKVPPMRG